MRIVRSPAVLATEKILGAAAALASLPEWSFVGHPDLLDACQAVFDAVQKGAAAGLFEVIP